MKNSNSQTLPNKILASLTVVTGKGPLYSFAKNHHNSFMFSIYFIYALFTLLPVLETLAAGTALAEYP